MNKILVIIMLTIPILISSGLVFGESENPLVIALNVFADGQTELINQNSILIEQNKIIITLLKGDRSIFVPQLTERYDLVKYIDYASCEFYDRLSQELKTGTCPIVGLTKDQFNSRITGDPEK